MHTRILPGEPRSPAYKRIPAAIAQRQGWTVRHTLDIDFEKDATIDVEAGFPVCLLWRPRVTSDPNILLVVMSSPPSTSAPCEVAGAYDALERYLSKNGGRAGWCRLGAAISTNRTSRNVRRCTNPLGT